MNDLRYVDNLIDNARGLSQLSPPNKYNDDY